MKNIGKLNLVIGILICLAAVVAAAIILFHREPENVSVEKVFIQGIENTHFLQASLYVLGALKENKLIAGGHVRYARNNQIYGYGEGNNGSRLTVLFEDTQSSAYKNCLTLISQGIPFKKELFIAGTGITGVDGHNPAIGTLSGPGVITFQSLAKCSYENRLP